ncbi:MAG TPA: hypothetical protein VJB94_02205 [Candidatus Nanoarchaeia archaeon]|nr:hypothetical protein [Candidatus Nanoarchaeia archaeon]
MEIDDFLQEKKAHEAKERLEEAKRKLREEKERLKEEQRKLKEGNKSANNSEDKPAKEPGEYALKPWMLWDLMILALVAIFFVIAMLYPKGAAGVSREDTLKIIDEKTAKIDELTKTVDTLKEDVRKLGATPIDATSGQELDKEVRDALITSADTPKGLSDFTIKIEDSAGNEATGGTIEANGTEIKYKVIVQNLETKDLKCKVNKIIDNGSPSEIGYFHVDKVAKETLTQDYTKKGTSQLKYSAKCAYAKLEVEKWVETSDYSKELDATLELILH